jgi:hypothetical protein
MIRIARPHHGHQSDHMDCFVRVCGQPSWRRVGGLLGGSEVGVDCEYPFTFE